VAHYLGEDDFCFTYGDGVADVNIRELVAMHKSKKTKATLTQYSRRVVSVRWFWRMRTSPAFRKNPRRRRLDQWRVLRAFPERD